jgi:hypothetical protein
MKPARFCPAAVAQRQHPSEPEDILLLAATQLRKAAGMDHLPWAEERKAMNNAEMALLRWLNELRRG